MPATYLDIMSDLRDLYATLPDAKVAGLTARSFSINAEGGRCPECKGRGVVNLQMRFLADARVRCSVCQGKRFRPHVLDVKFQNLNINDVLNLTLDQAFETFKHHRKIFRKLTPAIELGLGYLKMGQPSSSLSGGESQRLKLVPFFQRKFSEKHLIVIDEPTVGLHAHDVEKLCISLEKLSENGATQVIVDNNIDILAIADWHINIGPESAEKGGQIIHEGKPDASYLNS